ncbi:hypothetical protein MNBD_GAMMA12-3243 [hydrothermal vent metagenome]|uniref:DUF4349 domain-containing protein n=1 Tax=hydrothermal vent metagenome TaxID=652676 RepID=A0A3B0YUG7_9ZZZZ
MTNKIIRKTTIALVVFASVFLLLFLLRMVWGYSQYPNGIRTQTSNSRYISSIQLKKSNISSYKGKFRGKGRSVSKVGTVPTNTSTAIGKYERVGSIESHTKKFVADEERVNNIVTKFKSIIQYKQKTGLKRKHNRLLKLGIGVDPDQFDEMIEALRKVGTIVHFNIEQVEKTDEYKKLQVKRVSLEKMRAALIKYRGKGDKVKDLISLEDRILGVEKEIQSFAVSIGEFNSVHEFVTVKLALVERIVKKKTIEISFSHRLKVSLEWTISTYASLLSLLYSIVVLCLYGIIGTLSVLVLIAVGAYLLERFKVVNFNPAIIQFRTSDKSKKEDKDEN